MKFSDNIGNIDIKNVGGDLFKISGRKPIERDFEAYSQKYLNIIINNIENIKQEYKKEGWEKIYRKYISAPIRSYNKNLEKKNDFSNFKKTAIEILNSNEIKSSITYIEDDQETYFQRCLDRMAKDIELIKEEYEKEGWRKIYSKYISNVIQNYKYKANRGAFDSFDYSNFKERAIKILNNNGMMAIEKEPIEVDSYIQKCLDGIFENIEFIKSEYIEKGWGFVYNKYINLKISNYKRNFGEFDSSDFKERAIKILNDNGIKIKKEFIKKDLYFQKCLDNIIEDIELIKDRYNKEGWRSIYRKYISSPISNYKIKFGEFDSSDFKERAIKILNDNGIEQYKSTINNFYIDDILKNPEEYKGLRSYISLFKKETISQEKIAQLLEISKQYNIIFYDIFSKIRHPKISTIFESDTRKITDYSNVLKRQGFSNNLRSFFHMDHIVPKSLFYATSRSSITYGVCQNESNFIMEYGIENINKSNTNPSISSRDSKEHEIYLEKLYAENMKYYNIEKEIIEKFYLKNGIDIPAGLFNWQLIKQLADSGFDVSGLEKSVEDTVSNELDFSFVTEHLEIERQSFVDKEDMSLELLNVIRINGVSNLYIYSDLNSEAKVKTYIESLGQNSAQVINDLISKISEEINNKKNIVNSLFGYCNVKLDNRQLKLRKFIKQNTIEELEAKLNEGNCSNIIDIEKEVVDNPNMIEDTEEVEQTAKNRAFIKISQVEENGFVVNEYIDFADWTKSPFDQRLSIPLYSVGFIRSINENGYEIEWSTGTSSVVVEEDIVKIDDQNYGKGIFIEQREQYNNMKGTDGEQNMSAKRSNKTVKIANKLNNHLEGKTTDLSNKIFAEIANKAIKAGFNGPFKVLKIAAIGGGGFDFHQPARGQDLWTATYNVGDMTLNAEVKKTPSGVAIWKILDSNGNQLGWGSFMEEPTRTPARQMGWGQDFNRQYPPEVEKCIRAADMKLEEILSQQQV